MKSRLVSVQILRGIAAMTVVVGHAIAWQKGGVGVDIFFVISGVVIGLVMVGKKPGQFIADRIWRIYPPYLIASIPFFASDPIRLAASLTLWPIWWRMVPPYLGTGWSLCFEMLFYVGTMAALWSKPRWLVIWAYVAFLGLYLLTFKPLFFFIGNPLALEFLAGLLILRLPKRPQYSAILIACGLLVLYVSPVLARAPLVYGTEPNWRVVYWGIPAALIVYGMLSLEPFFTGKALLPLVKLGDASYSIYLTHVFVIEAARLSPFLAIPLCVAVGFAFHFAVEKPLLRLRRTKGHNGLQPQVAV